MSALATRSKQTGVMLLEALVALLIFSIGILAVVGLQGMAVENVSEAKYRTDASFLASQIIGQMWVNRTNLANYKYSGGAAPKELANWLDQVNATLPGAGANPPSIDVSASNVVTVTMFWQRPADANAAAPPPPHQYLVTASINWE
jgi:type IV pilus assembly protein PilV